VHGKLYKSLFNEEPIGVTGSGFAIRKGHWRWRSGTFNSWLPAGMQAAMMDDKEQVFVKVHRSRGSTGFRTAQHMMAIRAAGAGTVCAGAIGYHIRCHIVISSTSCVKNCTCCANSSDISCCCCTAVSETVVCWLYDTFNTDLQQLFR
jgi:hypothetical protein